MYRCPMLLSILKKSISLDQKKLEVARSITSLPEDFKFDVSKWTQALTDIVVNLTEISDLQNLVNNKCDQFSYQRRTIEKFIFGNIETFSNLIETLKKEDNKETLREILKSLREASKGIKNREGSDRNDDKMEILNSESAWLFNELDKTNRETNEFKQTLNNLEKNTDWIEARNQKFKIHAAGGDA